jgi:hypothetical protein
MFDLNLNTVSLLFGLFVLTLVGMQNDSKFVQAQPLPSPSDQSDQSYFWDAIDTRFGGRLRVTGRAVHADDDTIFEPVGTGTYGNGSFNFRIINETFFSDSIFTDVAYELIGAGGDLIRKTNELNELFPNTSPNIIFPGAPPNDDRRLMDLTDTIIDKDSYFLVQRLDRLYVALLPQWGSLKIGRQAITWGNGFIFNPFDLFNPFPPTAIDRDFKIGDDMVNGQLSLPKIGDLQGLYIVRRNPNTNDVEADQDSWAAKFHFAAGTTEFDVMGAQHFDDYVTGIGSTGYLGEAAWRVDGTWTFLDSDDDYLSLVANMDYSWVWLKKNFYGFIEYYFNGLGKDDYQEAALDPAIAERLERGELFVLGQNYLSGHVQAELHPLFKVFFTAINNIEDPSGILQPRATWDITQNLQMTGGVNISYGAKGTEFGGFTLPGTDIHSKSPDNAYLWLIYYF